MYLRCVMIFFTFLIILVSFQNSVVAQNQNSKKTLTLPQILSLTLEKNPQLGAYLSDIRAKEARALQASYRPNPDFEIEFENFKTAGFRDGFDLTETTVQFSQLIELAGKRSKRAQVASLGSDISTWNYEAIRLDILAGATKAYIDVLTAQENVKLNEELVELAEQFLNVIILRINSGKVSPAEKSRAQVSLSQNIITLERSRLELVSAQHRLVSFWGETSPDFDKVEGILDTLISMPVLEKLIPNINRNPDIARSTTELELRSSILNYENAIKIPDLIVSGGFRRLNEINDNAFIFNLSLPIKLFNRNQGAIVEAQSEFSEIEKISEINKVHVQTSLVNVYNELKTNETHINMYRSSLLSESLSAFNTINEGYLRGLFSFLDVLDAQRTLFDIRSQYITTLNLYHKAAVDINRLIGNDFINQYSSF